MISKTKQWKLKNSAKNVCYAVARENDLKEKFSK